MPNASTLLVNQLYAHTAGTATNRPKAVVTSASEIPPATADRPAVLPTLRNGPVQKKIGLRRRPV